MKRLGARRKPRPRESILWIEGIGFSLIIAMIWLTDYFQLSQLWFADPPTFNFVRPTIRSLVVIVVWLAVHFATRRLLKRLHQLEEYLLICAWCRRIGHDSDWISMEQYFGSALSTPTTHGICPDCAEKVRASVEAERVDSK